MYLYNWITLLCTWNIVRQLYFNKIYIYIYIYIKKKGRVWNGLLKKSTQQNLVYFPSEAPPFVKLIYKPLPLSIQQVTHYWELLRHMQINLVFSPVKKKNSMFVVYQTYIVHLLKLLKKEMLQLMFLVMCIGKYFWWKNSLKWIVRSKGCLQFLT